MADTALAPEEKVGNGIRFLDDNYPGFRGWVVPDQVKMRSANECMLFRASRMSFWVVTTKHDLTHADLVRLGFSIPKDSPVSEWDLLQAEWMKHAFGIEPAS